MKITSSRKRNECFTTQAHVTLIAFNTCKLQSTHLLTKNSHIHSSFMIGIHDWYLYNSCKFDFKILIKQLLAVNSWLIYDS